MGHAPVRYRDIVADPQPKQVRPSPPGARGHPKGHRPSPRVPAIGADLVHRAVQTYAALHPEIVDATAEYAALVTTLLDDGGINSLSVTGGPSA